LLPEAAVLHGIPQESGNGTHLALFDAATKRRDVQMQFLIAAQRSACEACAPRVHGTMFEGERFDGRGLNHERLS